MISLPLKCNFLYAPYQLHNVLISRFTRRKVAGEVGLDQLVMHYRRENDQFRDACPAKIKLLIHAQAIEKQNTRRATVN